MYFTKNTKVKDVIKDESFKGFGKLLFPVDLYIDENRNLIEAGKQLMWYERYADPNKTVEILNYFKEERVKGNQIFYDIYTEEEKKHNSDLRNTGLFFFRGKENAKVAITNAGGGFVYVGALHDSFPHSLEISRHGYNSFALIYRPGWRTAMEDLARAIAFLFEHQKELKIDMSHYSLWGGSAGARMAATLGSYGTKYFHEKEYPRPGAVIMQYTGHDEVNGYEPPTYNCVGTQDGIASYRTMQYRIQRIKENGTPAEIEIFRGLSHGFGLGTGTVAEGWIERAIQFWERNS